MNSPLDGHPRLAIAVWAVGTVAVSAIAIGASHAMADTDSGHEVTRFDRVSTTHPTLVDRIVVRGEGCLAAEDSTRLRLVAWEPSRETVVYRCVQP